MDTMIPCAECGWGTEADVDRLVCEADGTVLCDECAHVHSAHMLECDACADAEAARQETWED